MKAVILPQYNNNVLRALLSLKVEERPIPIPGSGEVVVKMHAATCNPSDIAFIRGGYNIVKAVPAIPGFEASGTVVETGVGCEDLAGKKISCFVQSDHSGTWSEYILVNSNDLLVLDEHFDADQAAAFSVNPFTAYGMMEIARLRESKAIMQNASGGQVAHLIRGLAKLYNIKVIDIVRKPETAETLRQQHEFVLCEQDEGFEKQLKELANELDASTTFDAVGGILSGQMFNAMPGDSELVVYGGLSGKRMSDINEMDLIFNNKIISGFNLMDWKEELEPEEFESVSDELQQLFIEDKLATVFQSTTHLEDIKDGLKSYIGNMSAGKLLIKP